MQQQSTLDPSWSAFVVTMTGFIIPLVLQISQIFNIFDLLILNYTIILLISQIIFFIFSSSILHALSEMYSKIRYFHFFLTTSIFSLIFYWSLQGVLQNGSSEQFLSLRIFLISNIFYHFGEFYFTAFCHEKQLCWSSFLINHSKGYTAALVLALLEYFLGIYLIPTTIFPSNLHDNVILIYIGITFSIFGHFLRMGAFWCAKITSGVYSFSRHPSYLGFFSYSLGGQLIFGNIFSFVVYTYVLFDFFLKRIVNEEHYLIKFFGEDYIKYQERVPIRIPFMLYAINKKFKEDKFQD